MASKQEWLRRVASASGANLASGWAGEILGMTEDDEEAMSDAEHERLIWAVEEVQRRLYAMGRKP